MGMEAGVPSDIRPRNPHEPHLSGLGTGLSGRGGVESEAISNVGLAGPRSPAFGSLTPNIAEYCYRTLFCRHGSRI